MIRKVFFLVWGILVLLFSVPEYTGAHEIRPAIANLVVQENGAANGTVMLNLESLIAEIGPEHENTETSANSNLYETLRSLPSAELMDRFERFKPKLIEGIRILADDGKLLSVTIDSATIPSVGDIELPRDSLVYLSFKLPSDQQEFTVNWAAGFGEIIVRAESQDKTLDYAALLAPGQTSSPINVLSRSMLVAPQSIAQTFQNYLIFGFTHIIPKGLDHIVFVIGLFLFSARWKPLLVQVTAFTVAHTLTLALGATGYLQLPGSFVEPMIAASIVFVAIDNLLQRPLGKLRVLLVFGFGLLHGLGFAGVLGEVGLGTTHFVLALLSFNLGVEIGQLFVIVLCMLVIGLWARDKPWYHQRVTVPCSVVIGLAGLAWLVQRLS